MSGISWFCKHAGYAHDVGNKEPSFGTCDSFLPVFCHTAASTKPCKGPLDDPFSGNDLEALRSVGALGDLASNVRSSPAHEELDDQDHCWTQKVRAAR